MLYPLFFEFKTRLTTDIHNEHLHLLMRSWSPDEKWCTKWLQPCVCQRKNGKHTRSMVFLWGFPYMGMPQNGWFMMKHAIKIDKLGVPSFEETSIYDTVINNNLLTGMHPSNAAHPIKPYHIAPFCHVRGGLSKTCYSMTFHYIFSVKT